MNTHTFAILIVCFVSIVFADDFRTINGKEYNNVTVSRVEVDGIVLKSKSGISKVYFAELPKDVQERFHYAPPKAAQSSATSTPAQSNTAVANAATKNREQSNATKTNRLSEQAGTPKLVELEYRSPEQLIAAAHKAAQEKMFSPEEEKQELAKIPAGGTVGVTLYSAFSDAADPKWLTYMITCSSGELLDRRRGNPSLPRNIGDYSWVGYDEIDLPGFEDSLRIRIYHEIFERSLGDYIITRNAQPQRIQ